MTTFHDFLESGQVRKMSPDPSLVRALLQTADSDLLFLEPLEINSNSARKIMSNYYDVLRSIIEALAVKTQFKVYSHEAYTYFLKEKTELLLAEKFDRYRKIRNKINYDGSDISVEEVREYKEEIKRMILEIKSKYFV